MSEKTFKQKRKSFRDYHHFSSDEFGKGLFQHLYRREKKRDKAQRPAEATSKRKKLRRTKNKE